MPLARLSIRNFKSIKNCDIALSDLNIFIGENGAGKSNVLDAIRYFYSNLTSPDISTEIFDENNPYSNEVHISITYDLTEFVKIAKAHNKKKKKINEIQYGGYYKAIIAMTSNSANKKFRIDLSQIKGLPIRWNYTYEQRLMFKTLFPIFCIDTRSLDVAEWTRVWDILGELVKVSNAERKNIKSKVSEILLNRQCETSKKLKAIEDIFELKNVSIKPASAKEFGTNISKIFFSGENIRQRGKNLHYYSDGTNSVKYIELLLECINRLSTVKMKEPIILFDEPEIGLHTNNIDELAEAIVDLSSKLNVLVATHSSRLTKNFIVGPKEIGLYNVKLVNKHSLIHRMKKFPQYTPASKYRVVDDHINSYFSKAVFFVEGESELELFSNPYLRMLFPKLKKIDIFKAISEKPVLDIMNPKLSNSQIPYLCLVDIDKVISYDQNRKRFILKSEYLPEESKEYFCYRNKHEKKSYLYFQRKRINAMQEKLHIHYHMPFLSCDDPNYYEFVYALHQYLLSYNIFCLNTTIEGALINSITVNFALEFLKRSTKKGKIKDSALKNFNTCWEKLKNNDRTNLLRMLFNGKSDLLKSRKDIFKKFENDSIKAEFEQLTIGKKTSGWISDYLDSFFQSVTGIKKSFSEKSFRRYLEDDKQRKKIEVSFQQNFCELHSLIERLCAMIER